MLNKERDREQDPGSQEAEVNEVSETCCAVSLWSQLLSMSSSPSEPQALSSPPQGTAQTSALAASRVTLPDYFPGRIQLNLEQGLRL